MINPAGAELQRSSKSCQRPGELLRAYISDSQIIQTDEMQQLISELDARQLELEAQNKELQEAKRQLEAYRDRYTNLYDFAPIGYLTLDEDGYVQEINLAGAKMLGVDRDTITGYALGDYVAKEHQSTFQDHLRQCHGEHREATAELHLMASDGRSIAVQLRSVPVDEPEAIHCKTAITDISERKRAEEMIQEKHNLLRTLIDNLLDPTYIKDAQGRFVEANLATARIMGAETPADLLGKTDFDFYPEEVAAAYHADEQALMRSGEPLVNKDEPHIDPQGNLRAVLTTKVPIKDSQGTVVGIVGISRDITDRN